MARISHGRLAAVLVALMALSSVAHAKVETSSRKMGWDDCLAAKAEMQAKLDVVPRKVIDIVSSASLAVTRLCTSEGTVAISCSKSAQILIVKFRPQQSELSCLWRSLLDTGT